ncbi:DegT/DnrJ/EryC1/StrS family aminotransferase [Candidatus Aerophobetes bacterium]|nr:DegT/DnrJ/EryC1/StrS family aminotransferase [Candidatus Aerophobetes bacterium]
MAEKLALKGGKKAVTTPPGDLFTWPIITKEVEEAVLKVLRAGNMSGTDVTAEFEREFAQWLGVKYALAHNNGTAALHSAMFGLGIGKGDEIICPSITYWASCLPVFSLGGTVVFADIDPHTLCINPEDIEHRITERTKAIVVVHYCGYPCEMDAIMDIAHRHSIKVIEDASHAHGGLYKGRMVGTIGDVSAFSLMSGKSFAIGEGGIMVTNDREIYERAVIFGHYIRHSSLITLGNLKAGMGLPWGGYKYRMHQLSSAMGRVQLKKYPQEMAEIDKAMNYFWDLLEGTPGIRAHRPPRNSGSSMGGWYSPHGIYYPEELEGLSVSRFCEAVRAEGVTCEPGCNKALHLHPLLNNIDVYNQGKPLRIANLPEGVDIRESPGSLPVAERIQERVFSVPWFKHYRPKIIEEYALAFKKVAENYKELLPGDKGNPQDIGGWGLSKHIIG